MRLKDWWPFIGLLALFVFGWLLGQGRHAYISQNTQPSYPAHGYEPLQIPAGDLATWAAAFVALVGLIVAVLQFRALRDANRTADRAAKAAEDANYETKRSVDAFIESERGVWLDRDGDTDIAHTLFSFEGQNIGRSTLVLKQYQFRFSARDFKTPWKLTDDRGAWSAARVVRYVVDPKERWVSGVYDIHFDIPDDHQGKAFYETANTIEIRLIYFSIGTYFLHQCAWHYGERYATNGKVDRLTVLNYFCDRPITTEDDKDEYYKM